MPGHAARRQFPIPTTLSRLLLFPWRLQYSLCLLYIFFSFPATLSDYFPAFFISVILTQVNIFLYATWYFTLNHTLHTNSSLHFFVSEYFDNIRLAFSSSRVCNITQCVRFTERFRTISLTWKRLNKKAKRIKPKNFWNVKFRSEWRNCKYLNLNLKF